MAFRIPYRSLLNTRSLRKGFLKEVLFPILIGITLGFIFGQIKFTKNSDSHSDAFTQQLSLDDYETFDGGLFFLRCVVMVHPSTKRPLSFMMAIRDTYGEQCNQTIFYTNSEEIHKKVNDQRVFLIDSYSNAYHWPYLHHVMKHSLTVPAQWTIFLDEQVFLRVPNLRRALYNFNHRDPIILGRILTTKTNFFFPFISQERITLQAGIVMSQSAIRQLLTCKTSRFFTPASEKVLYSCAKEKHINIVDPVDEENMHLFHHLDLKTLIPQAMENEGHNCCSDHAVTFGQISHKELRMAHYASEKWAVFGVYGVHELNRTHAIDPKLLIYKPKTTTIKPKTTTTKKPQPAAKKKRGA